MAKNDSRRGEARSRRNGRRYRDRDETDSDLID